MKHMEQAVVTEFIWAANISWDGIPFRWQVLLCFHLGRKTQTFLSDLSISVAECCLWLNMSNVKWYYCSKIMHMHERVLWCLVEWKNLNVYFLFMYLSWGLEAISACTGFAQRETQWGGNHCEHSARKSHSQSDLYVLKKNLEQTDASFIQRGTGLGLKPGSFSLWGGGTNRWAALRLEFWKKNSLGLDGPQNNSDVRWVYVCR